MRRCGVLAPTRLVRGLRVPVILYGTAWKEGETRSLTRLAIAQGFRGIDTANQRKHYVEAAVGEAVRDALASAAVTRDALFLQTKFTSADGQDHRLPYDAGAPVARQVEQSFARSLEHLGVDDLDALVLHGPTTRHGLAPDDWAAWRAMEGLHRSGRVRLLGASNVTLEQLELLVRDAAVRPAFVQNRCYARTRWDAAVRAFCARHDVVYQGFSLLTANRAVVAGPAVRRIADRTAHTPEQIIFAFAHAMGMLALTGTSSAAHMHADLSALALALPPADLEAIERAGS